jgi:predicted alpha/beta-fold hydrolase
MIAKQPLISYVFTYETKQALVGMMGLYTNLEGFTEEDIYRCKNLVELDTKFTCIAFGHATPEEHYQATSSKDSIPDITIPTLIINALDDPIIDQEAIPVKDCEENENIILCLLPKGGHLAFLEGHWPTEECWTDRVVMQYFNTIESFKYPELRDDCI